jgi:hypothetical protein
MALVQVQGLDCNAQPLRVTQQHSRNAFSSTRFGSEELYTHAPFMYRSHFVLVRFRARQHTEHLHIHDWNLDLYSYRYNPAPSCP